MMFFSTNEHLLLSDPLSMLPPSGPSNLKILIEVPDYSEAMKPNVKLTVLEAVRFKFSWRRDPGLNLFCGDMQKPPTSGAGVHQKSAVNLRDF